MDLYLSTTAEFNNTTFYDHYAGAPTYVTATRFSEAIRPWHSSSFVFDGGVVDVKMKGLAGQYRLKNSGGVLSDTPSNTDSYNYVHNAFDADGTAIKRLTGPYEIAPRLALPAGMHFENAKLRSNGGGTSLQVLEGAQSTPLLNAARAPFELVVSQHAIQFDEAVSFPAPMIYQDTQRSFFVKPEWQQVIAGYNKTLQLLRYTFSPIYHPYTALFLRELKRNGLEGLLNRKIQLNPQTFYPGNSFAFGQYGPTVSAVAADSAAHDDRRLRPPGRVQRLQLGDVLPRPADDRHQAQPEPAVRGGDALVPLHLRPDEHRRAAVAAAVLGDQAVLRAERRRLPQAAHRAAPRPHRRQHRAAQRVEEQPVRPAPHRPLPPGRLPEATW